MARDRRHHVHPETYDPQDPLDIRELQLHRERWLCDATYCTFADYIEVERDRLAAVAKDLKAELAAEPHERHEA